MKNYHDQRIERRKFVVGDFVLLFNSRICLFAVNLTSKWTGTFLITNVFPQGLDELENKEGEKFTVNGQGIKINMGHAKSVHEVIEAYILDEV